MIDLWSSVHTLTFKHTALSAHCSAEDVLWSINVDVFTENDKKYC